jgi:hypothetical protein
MSTGLNSAVRILAKVGVATVAGISLLLLPALNGQAQASPVQPHVTSSCNGQVPSGTVVATAATNDDGGYWLATNYGQVVACGDAPNLGDADTALDAPIVGFAPTADDGGYYLVGADGGIYAFGAATFNGSLGGMPLNKPIVGMALDPATGGYWLVASDGGIFNYNAPYLGSTGAMHLNKPIVGMAVSGNGTGYWLVASDGGIFSFGDAPFHGSTGAMHLNKPIVGMSVDPGTGGYWLVASDGGIFAFDAPFLGSTGNITLNEPITGMEANTTGSGYRFVASDGGVFNYGSPYDGSAVEPPAVTAPPGTAPTCTVKLSTNMPKGYSQDLLTVTSNVPDYQVLVAKIYATETIYIGGFSTDTNGAFSLYVTFPNAPLGHGEIAIAIGPASCYASFTRT